MNVKDAYNIWAQQFDTNNNKTRDLEGIVLREILDNIDFDNCLEIGCGTGKNTEWLITKSKQVTAIDFSYEMLAKAKQKILSDKVNFEQADITQNWNFANRHYDLITFSLVLEHIENLEHIFNQLYTLVESNGHVYIGELHPFKQYQGSKARFDTESGQQTVICYTHNISDFILPAKKYGFEIININEHFDDDDKSTIPRILSILLKKP